MSSCRAQNVTSSSTVVAALEGARDSKAPVILQVSQGGAAFFGGKGLKNGNQEGSIAGAVAAAHYIRAIAPAYGMCVLRNESKRLELALINSLAQPRRDPL